MLCPSCGYNNTSGARFCGSSGTVLPYTVPAGVRSTDIRRRSVRELLGEAGSGHHRQPGRSPHPFGLQIGAHIMTGLQGRTVGKMALGIKVIRSDAMPPGLGYAALREIVGKFVSSLVLLLGFLWIALDPKKKGWHDYIAGTVVVKVK